MFICVKYVFLRAGGGFRELRPDLLDLKRRNNTLAQREVNYVKDYCFFQFTEIWVWIFVPLSFFFCTKYVKHQSSVLM